MTALQKYIRHFASLRRATGQRGLWTDATRNRAPHKPLLLLGILDLAARGELASNFIDVTGDLNELNDLFTGYWRRVVPLGQKSSIAFPFSRLNSEPFWELVTVNGKELSPAIINSITSVNQLRVFAVGARIDEDLFVLMQHPESRSALRETLLQSCFSEHARSALEEQVEINNEAFDYGRVLERRAHIPLVKEAIEAEKYKPAARDQGFRRIVVTAYDHRCALCGVRIITPEGHTVVDAAHIVRWSETQNDDIRNGVALCKICHWAFDEGMMGVSDSYTVITSRQIGAEPNVPGLLLTLSGRKIIPPEDRDLWPAREYISSHRRKFRL